jgi:hypothetical protein
VFISLRINDNQFLDDYNDYDQEVVSWNNGNYIKFKISNNNINYNI